MDSIKIAFNPLLFKQLLQVIYLGRWMAASHRDDPDISLKEIEQHIYAHAKDFGLEQLIDFDSTHKKYLPSAAFEEEMSSTIQEYDDFTFWDELAWQMAERDFDRKFDHAQILCMTDDEIFREKNLIADRYFDEFSTKGLENLKLIN
jgi:hypothetical protein